MIEVTSLEDSGPGTLRACVEADGPRTCIFRVAGTIALKRELVINHPYLTIAGQTAPGDGILLKDRGMIIRASHVVVRYLRIRPGASSLPANNNCISILYPEPGGPHPENVTHDVIVDHCSVSWGTDDNLMVWGDGRQGVSGVTYQWNIISEGLTCQNRVSGCGSRALLIGSGANQISVHHNLFAHNYLRHPESLDGCDLDFVNNLIYDHGGGQAPSILSGRARPSHVNLIGNLYIQGLEGPAQREREVRLIGGTNNSTIFISENIGRSRPNLERPEEMVVWHDAGGFTVVPHRHRFPPVVTTGPFLARTEILQQAGATLPRRDAVDARIVLDVIKGTGRLIGYPNEVGGWPFLKTGNVPADRDHDGMPDAWESEHQLNPDESRDGSEDRDGDGYTNLEEYLNGLKN